MSTTNNATAAGWVPGVDASYAELTPAIAASLRQAGVVVWWQCLWTGVARPAFALANLAVARDAGMTLAAYGSVTASPPGWWHAEKTREGVPDDLWAQLVVVPCDVELDGIPVYAVRDFVDTLAGYGKHPAIYTSWDAWHNKLGNPLNFTDCVLCNALWDLNPDVNFAGLPFGAWTPAQVLLEQYTGGTTVDGILVDRDTWNAALLAELTTEGPMDAPTKGEFGALYARVDKLYGVTVALAGAFFALAQTVYGADEPKLAALRTDFAALQAQLAPQPQVAATPQPP